MREGNSVRLLYRYTCRHSVHSSLPSCLISTDTCTILHKTTIWPVVCVWVWNFVSILKGKVLAEATFEPKMEEVTGDWRKAHSEKLHDLHSSSNTMRLIKLKGMKWAGHLTCMGERRNTHSEFWWGKIKNTTCKT